MKGTLEAFHADGGTSVTWTQRVPFRSLGFECSGSGHTHLNTWRGVKLWVSLGIISRQAAKVMVGWGGRSLEGLCAVFLPYSLGTLWAAEAVPLLSGWCPRERIQRVGLD